MLNESKPFASLGPTLLARKGGARPAMRPQLSPLMSNPIASSDFESDLDDLGWNDMGAEDTRPSPLLAADIYQPLELSTFDCEEDADEEIEPANESIYGSLLTSPNFEQGEDPLPENSGEGAGIAALAEETAATLTPQPEVRRQQENLAAALMREPAPARRKAAAERRAAFTLRLDAERHLKLRLASTVHNISAQQLVTQALDEFLANIPDIDALAAQVKRA